MDQLNQSFGSDDNKYIPQNSRVMSQQVALRYVETMNALNVLSQIQSQSQRQQELQDREFVTTSCQKTSFVCVYGLIFLFSSIFPELYGSESCVSLKKYTFVMGCGLLILSGVSILNIFTAVLMKNYEVMNHMSRYLDTLAGCFNLLMTFILIIVVCKNDADCGVLPALVWIHTVLTILPICCLCFICIKQ